MHGVEHNNNNHIHTPATRGRGRGRAYYHNINNRQNRGDRPRKNRNPFGSLDNPFQELNLDETEFQDEQGPQQRRNRNHNHRSNSNEQDDEDQTPYRLSSPVYRGRVYHRQYQTRHQDINPPGTSTPDSNASDINNDDYNNYSPNSGYSHNSHHASPNSHQFPADPTTAIATASSAPVPASRSISPARLVRFCTECSTVRRANITLRDWCTSALSRASEVLDSWSNEVGVSRGSGDEMDWQPEPVIRVLILAPTNASASQHGSAGSSTGNSPVESPVYSPVSGGSEWGLQQSSYNSNSMGSAFGCALGGDGNGNYATGTASSSMSWGLRPGTLSPASSNGGNVGGSGGPGLGVVSSGNGSVGYDAFGMQSV
ncbi:hypothetical protein F5Y10DRAFT_204629 [Nemania abortiva]|nr:hypothetical protein F5Y10DRAFT_204629 [Nemania abortiva]